MENLKKMMSKDFLNGIKFMGGFKVTKVKNTTERYVYSGNRTSSESSEDEDSVSSDDVEKDGAFIDNEEPTLENDHHLVNKSCDTDNDCSKYDRLEEDSEKLPDCDSKPIHKKYYKSQYSDVLNLQIVEILENDLDLYEKISIVFLVYEDSQLEYALQRLTVACKDDLKTHNLLSDWCLTEPKFWREKLLQALVLIKNFYVLMKLGYKKNDAKCLFHKKSYISSIRKQIYYFCESLSIEETKCLIDIANNDLKMKNTFNNDEIFECDAKFLEMSFLFWLSRKYVCFYSKSVNLTNLIECLDDSNPFLGIRKKLDMINKKFNVPKNKVKTNSNFDTQNSEKENENSNCETGLPSVENNFVYQGDDLNSVASISTTATASSVSDNNWSQEFQQQELIPNVYQIIDPKEVGLCIIINQKNFDHREKDPNFQRFLSKEILPNRDGTDADAERIRVTFTNLCYKVIVFNDLTHIEVLNCIKASVKQQFKPGVHSSIFLFMLTHGFQGHVYACNSIPLPIESIKKMLWGCNCLVGKPKGIIIQACQGNAPQEVIVTDGPDDRPVQTKLQGQCDLFLGLATVAGHVAFRHTKSGTWFIQILCQCIEDFAHTTDFAKIFTRVSNKISKMRASDVTGTHVYGQVSEFRSSLCCEWYLVPPKSCNVMPLKNIP